LALPIATRSARSGVGDLGSVQERIQLFKNLAIIGGLLLVADQDGRT
jgi:hypothetical protein